MTCRKRSFWKLALTLSLLGVVAGCSNDSSESRPGSPTGAQPVPQEAEMLEMAGKGNNARVKELLDKGIDVNVRGKDGNTPIMEAAYAGHFDTVKLLLDHGADLSAKKNDGATPIGLAGRSKVVVELFQNVTALVDAATKGNTQVLKGLIDKGTPVNGLDHGGNSALQSACYAGKIEAVRLLLEKGANPNIKKSDGETPLSLAMGQKHADIVALIREAIAKRPKGPTTPGEATGTPAAK